MIPVDDKLITDLCTFSVVLGCFIVKLHVETSKAKRDVTLIMALVDRAPLDLGELDPARFVAFFGLLRLTVFVCRAVDRFRGLRPPTGRPTVKEMDQAFKLHVKLIQDHYFPSLVFWL